MKKTFALATLAFAVSASAFTTTIAVASEDEAANELPIVSVYKSPTCGCCEKWVDHLEENGFTVEVNDTDNIQAIKEGFGVPAEMTSCHTAFVGDYFVEGHVPASEIKSLLATYPDIRGIAVPGMPINSPGMEVPNYPSEPYEVISVGADGEMHVRSVIEP
jgi:hypothetical protein